MGLPEEEYFASGHRACAGCGAAIVLRHLLKAAGKNTIVVSATGCMEVVSSPYPETAWKVPWIHSAFENASAVASGIDAALKKAGKRDKTNILVIGGDGGTFDIGLQSLSGAAERGNKFTYICYDNEAYMNTGIQRSGSTPKYASTTTSPYGEKIHGKQQFKKDMPFILAAHSSYSATANISEFQDFFQKVKKSFSRPGLSYIQVFSPCPTGWKYPTELGIKIAKLAFDSRVTPIYEIEGGVLKITRETPKPVPVLDYLKSQKRFELNEKEAAEVQEYVDSEWKRIKSLNDSKIKIF
ncbi:MAG: thiamine pyrophosphate-dependent enzyme [Candidatus Woesearchaeota archaeon]|nr:thiamine pyrophosphate-dependent enzyme [Candidatus Woesearchaeota archaeon]